MRSEKAQGLYGLEAQVLTYVRSMNKHKPQNKPEVTDSDARMTLF